MQTKIEKEPAYPDQSKVVEPVFSAKQAPALQTCYPLSPGLWSLGITPYVCDRHRGVAGIVCMEFRIKLSFPCPSFGFALLRGWFDCAVGVSLLAAFLNYLLIRFCEDIID